MGTRGPTAAAVTNVTQLAVVPKIRLRCPAHLQPAAKDVWKDTVGAKPVEYFVETDIPLLEAYCTQTVIYREAYAGIYAPRKDGSDPLLAMARNGYPIKNPLIDVMNQAQMLVASLSVKLRLNANARGKGEAPKKPGPRSARDGLMFSA